MKRMVAILTLIMFLAVLLSSTVEAAKDQMSTCYYTIEYLENGDYIITELATDISGFPSSKEIKSTKQGTKTASYYNSVGTKIWDITVTGSFSYTHGVSATATSASASVGIYSSNATFISKSASTSGNTATATGTVRYSGVNTTKSVSVSCDIYGNIY